MSCRKMSRVVRLAAPGPWGFRITGGRDFNKLITVTKAVLHPSRDENKNIVERPLSLSSSPGSLSQTPLRSLSPAPDPKSTSPSSGRRSISPVWRPREEKEESPYRGNIVPKGFQVGIGGCSSLSPIPSSHPVPRVSHSANSSPSEVRDHREELQSPDSVSSSKGLRAPDHRPLNRIDKDSEVYKMIQENRAAKEPPRQSNRFRQLQEALDADQDGAAVQFPGRFSPSAPVSGISKYHVCEKCGSSIVTEAVKIRDGCYRHHNCYTCTDCGLNLGMRGHFWFRDKMYCEKHAQQHFQAAEGSL
ncbi:PDZ and LIM domain protein 2 [Cetorhinus maximus]